MEKEIQMVMDKLDQIAAKIGTTVEQLWPWLVRQQYVEAFYSLGFLILFSITTFLCYRSITRDLSNPDWVDTDHGQFVFAANAVLGFISISVLAGAFLVFIMKFGGVFNPEYYALQDLIKMIK